jgi:hypothetical protein
MAKAQISPRGIYTRGQIQRFLGMNDDAFDALTRQIPLPPGPEFSGEHARGWLEKVERSEHDDPSLGQGGIVKRPGGYVI